MERPLPRMPGFEQVAFFGIRHCSPAGAYHASGLIRRLRPGCLLVELPADAQGLLPIMTRSDTRPPLAIAACREGAPGGLVLPLFSFSPEWRAVMAAHELGIPVRFIDLPSSLLFPLSDSQEAESAPMPDAEWELCMETPCLDTYLSGIDALTEAILEHPLPKSGADRIREGYMGVQIKKAIRDGFEDILVVTGAYHIAGLISGDTEEEGFISALPRDKAVSSLVPYRHLGKEPKAPGYLSMLYGCLESGTLDDLPARFLSSCALGIRKNGGQCPVSAVIDAVRLAGALAQIRAYSRPTLSELREAALCCFGDKEAVSKALREAEAEPSQGGVSPVGQVFPIRLDFERQLKALRLGKQPAVKLDLRFAIDEPTQAKRSFFLHRLAALGAPFATLSGTPGESGELWLIDRDSDAALYLSVCGRPGTSVRDAAAGLVSGLLASGIPDGLELAVLCGLEDVVAQALDALEEDAAKAVGLGCFPLVQRLIRLKERCDLLGMRSDGFDSPIERLYRRAALALRPSARCDAAASRKVAAVMNSLWDGRDMADDLLDRELEKISRDSMSSPYLAGLALAILLESGDASDGRCANEAIARLSPGADCERAALWLEGFMSRNVFALLGHEALWTEINRFVGGLDEASLARVLPPLRRALSPLRKEELKRLEALLERIWDSAGGDGKLRARWRLILGSAAFPGTELEGLESRLDGALSLVYGGSGQTGGLSEIFELFPAREASMLQRSLIERGELKKLLASPQAVKALSPDKETAGRLLAMRALIPEKSREAAREYVSKTAGLLEEGLLPGLWQTLRGALTLREPSPTGVGARVDIKRTVYKNLGNYDPERKALIPGRLYYQKKRPARERFDVVLALDQSGSMSGSALYGALVGSILCRIPQLNVSVTAFDHRAVDITHECARDPVAALFGVALGQGTDIAGAAAHCAMKVTRPDKTIFIMLTDLFEGGEEGALEQVLLELVNSGVRVLVLPALSDRGSPVYNEEAAARLILLGVSCAACPPEGLGDILADLMKSGAAVTGGA